MMRQFKSDKPRPAIWLRNEDGSPLCHEGGRQMLAQFADGVFATESDAVADAIVRAAKLRPCRAEIVEVTGPEEKPVAAVAVDEAPVHEETAEDTWEGYTKRDLLEAAEAAGVEVSQTDNKAEIRAALNAAGVSPDLVGG